MIDLDSSNITHKAELLHGRDQTKTILTSQCQTLSRLLLWHCTNINRQGLPRGSKPGGWSRNQLDPFHYTSEVTVGVECGQL
jgi:hypothetical protein